MNIVYLIEYWKDNGTKGDVCCSHERDAVIAADVLFSQPYIHTVVISPIGMGVWEESKARPQVVKRVVDNRPLPNRRRYERESWDWGMALTGLILSVSAALVLAWVIKWVTGP